MKPLTIRINDFCQIVGLGKTKTFELINDGALDVVKIGGRTLLTMESVEALIASSRVSSDDDQ